MKQAFLFGAIASVLAINSVMAAGENTVAAKSYVDNRVDTRQAKIPVAGTNSATTGTSVVMYTDTAGTIGERGIYSDSSSYTAGTDANKLATASALNGAIDDLPTIETTKLTCANSPTCDLWTIDNHQEVYGEDDSND